MVDAPAPVIIEESRLVPVAWLIVPIGTSEAPTWYVPATTPFLPAVEPVGE